MDIEPSLSLRTRETVARLTPAMRATSFMRVKILSFYVKHLHILSGIYTKCQLYGGPPLVGEIIHNLIILPKYYGQKPSDLPIESTASRISPIMKATPYKMNFFNYFS